MREAEMLLLQFECTEFFQANPYSLETAEGLSLRLGRKPELLQPILSKLARLEILEQIGEGPQSIYRYAEPVMMSERDIACETN